MTWSTFLQERIRIGLFNVRDMTRDNICRLLGAGHVIDDEEFDLARIFLHCWIISAIRFHVKSTCSRPSSVKMRFSFSFCVSSYISHVSRGTCFANQSLSLSFFLLIIWRSGLFLVLEQQELEQERVVDE